MSRSLLLTHLLPTSRLVARGLTAGVLGLLAACSANGTSAVSPAIVKARLEMTDEVDADSFALGSPAAQLQLTASSDADLELLVTTDVNLLAGPQNTPAPGALP